METSTSRPAQALLLALDPQHFPQSELTLTALWEVGEDPVSNAGLRRSVGALILREDGFAELRPINERAHSPSSLYSKASRSR